MWWAEVEEEEEEETWGCCRWCWNGIWMGGMWWRGWEEGGVPEDPPEALVAAFEEEEEEEVVVVLEVEEEEIPPVPWLEWDMEEFWPCEWFWLCPWGWEERDEVPVRDAKGPEARERAEKSWERRRKGAMVRSMKSWGKSDSPVKEPRGDVYGEVMK
jgi:hypothetical protein